MSVKNTAKNPLSNDSVLSDIAYAISVLESWLGIRWESVMKDQSTLPIMRCDFPYTVQDAGIANTYIVLNRDYQTLGSTSENGTPSEHYKDETGSHIWLSKTQIAELGEIPYYLYGGKFNPPWSSKKDAEIYLTRLKAFYQLVTQ